MQCKNSIYKQARIEQLLKYKHNSKYVLQYYRRTTREHGNAE